MFSRRLILAATAAAALGATPALAQQRVQIDFWHGLTQPLGGMLEQIAADFNGSQQRFQINASFRGAYPDTMVASIAAFRAGNAPHIVQMFEVGTATMLAARGATVPVHELLTRTGVQINFDDYLPAVRGYYSFADGRMASMPFNSSTAIMFYNKDHFRRAGLDPERAPATWAELRAAAQRLRAAGLQCPFTTAWPTWTQFEQFSAIHNTALASQSNGFGGLNAEMQLTNPLFVRHVTTLAEMARENTFRYGGRDGAGDALFASGECSIIHASSGARARFVREVPGGMANVGAAFLPNYEDVAGAPRNSVIGGASFWVLNAGPNRPRTADELQGIAEFFRFIARPAVAAKWHVDTGFLPVTRTAFQQVQATDFYRQNPGADIPARQLLRGEMTPNTMGFRLGNMPEIRVVIQEEIERVFQGQQTPQQAMDNANRRGNEILRNFERANRS
jgi:sn-glycerol 3-phosphate transport system substrate-binding protein